MHIAIDARSLYSGGTGDRTYFRQVITTMARLSPDDRWTLYADSADPDRESMRAPNITISPPLPAPIGALWNVTALAPRVRHDRADILHSQYMLPPIGRAPCPMVVTIHDVTFRLFPEWYPPRDRRVMNLLIPIAAKRAARVITDARSGASDIEKTMRIAPAKIAVIPCGVSDRFHPIEPTTQEVIRTRYGLPPTYLLGVGILRSRKNAAIALSAMAMLQSAGKWPEGALLALTGKFQDEEADKHKNNPAVRVLGFVPDEDLPALYAAATASVYPSLYEGFGLPPLESMASGCPVIAAETSSVPEVVGDCGFLLPARDVDAWAGAMLALLQDCSLRAEMSRKGVARAAQFTWERCAQMTLDVYREAAVER